jgi:sugar (pentulose or hexulose) kinase
MKKEVIAVFDVGKTNKKLLLFDKFLNLVFEDEKVIEEIRDDDGFECDDIEKLLIWIKDSVSGLVTAEDYEIKVINFSTYGATIVYLDKDGRRTAPVYNYLKPMPEDTLKGFYEKYGGVEEFSRKTASPALDMLNSGLQVYWLKYKKPHYWEKTRHILHFPQYLSYILTGQIVSDYTSIGCHTALWDFDNWSYHKWLADENITLPKPVSNSKIFKYIANAKEINVGIGIHDSSASLVPYLETGTGKEFILISSGTWAINMNPFSNDKLTADELRKDCLCYISVNRKQVKSSRLFLGHIHEINCIKISSYYGVDCNEFRNVTIDTGLLKKLISEKRFVFFPHSIPADYYADLTLLKEFPDFKTAYHQFMLELTMFEINAIRLALDKKDTTENIYITGGFARNEIFTALLATFFPDKNVYTTELHNATALGAAMVISPAKKKGEVDLALKRIKAVI